MSSSGQNNRQAFLFLAPAILLLGVFVLWPLVRAVGWSVQAVSVLDPERTRPVGLENYSWLLSDPRFRQAFANTANFALLVVPLQTVLAFFAALWVNRPEPEWRWLRTVFFIPVILSLPVLAVLWSMLYQPVQGDQMGLINRAVTFLGMPPRNWLGDPRTALSALAFMSIWQGLGFQMMIFLAGLQQLSDTQLEAARIDGAGPCHRLWHVILPGMRPTLMFVTVTTTLLSFRLFVQPYLMTRGGPEDATVSVVQMIYETTFLSRDLGLASAGTVLFLGIVLILMVVHHRVERRMET